MALHSILSVSVLLTVMEVVSALSTQVHGSYEDSNTARQVQRQQPANRLNDYQALLAHHLLSKLVSLYSLLIISSWGCEGQDSVYDSVLYDS